MGLIGAVVGGLLGKATKKSKAKSENKDKASSSSSSSSKELSLGSPPILLGGAAFAVLALVALARR